MMRRAGSADRLDLVEVPKPSPESTEVLVRVHAASVTRGDVVLRKMPKMVLRLVGETPKSIPGHEFAGVIEATGEAVTGFEVGDRVFGTTTGLDRGSYAEYLCVPQDGTVASIPIGIEHQQAAPVPVGAMAALHFLRAGGTGPGKRVLVNGAAGSVGSFAVQIARVMGAHVTGVSSASTLDLVASLGADELVDYTSQDFTDGERAYDVIFDAAGVTNAKKAGKVLAEHGKFVTTRTRRPERVEELLAVRDMMAGGSVRALIDRSYPLERIAEAHRYVEKGQKRGNVVVVVAPG